LVIVQCRFLEDGIYNFIIIIYDVISLPQMIFLAKKTHADLSKKVKIEIEL